MSFARWPKDPRAASSCTTSTATFPLRTLSTASMASFLSSGPCCASRACLVGWARCERFLPVPRCARLAHLALRRPCALRRGRSRPCPKRALRAKRALLCSCAPALLRPCALPRSRGADCLPPCRLEGHCAGNGGLRERGSREAGDGEASELPYLGAAAAAGIRARGWLTGTRRGPDST